MTQDTNSPRPVSTRHGGHPVLALVFITLGILILLQNFHMLDEGIWEALWKFWPLVLVLWGIQAILGHSRVSSLIVFILGLVLVGGIITLPMLGYGEKDWWHMQSGGEKTQRLTVGEQEYPDVTAREVNIDNGIGKVEVNDSTSSNLLDWDATYYSGYEPTLRHSQDGSTATIDIDAQHRNGLSWFMGSSPRYALTLGRPELKSSLAIDSGVGEVSVRLERLLLSTFKLQVGTGSADIDLSELSIPEKASSIDVGTGSCKLVIPSDVGLKLKYDVGLGSTKVGSTSLRGNGTYTSPDYDSSLRKLDLRVDIGTGSLTIVK